jgi:hypothetical protein
VRNRVGYSNRKMVIDKLLLPLLNPMRVQREREQSKCTCSAEQTSLRHPSTLRSVHTHQLLYSAAIETLLSGLNAYQLQRSRTANRRATVTPVLRSRRPRKDASGHSRHSGLRVSFIRTTTASRKGKEKANDWRIRGVRGWDKFRGRRPMVALSLQHKSRSTTYLAAHCPSDSYNLYC